jgi:hypothetical protein
MRITESLLQLLYDLWNYHSFFMDRPPCVSPVWNVVFEEALAVPDACKYKYRSAWNKAIIWALARWDAVKPVEVWNRTQWGLPSNISQRYCVCYRESVLDTLIPQPEKLLSWCWDHFVVSSVLQSECLWKQAYTLLPFLIIDCIFHPPLNNSWNV